MSEPKWIGSNDNTSGATERKTGNTLKQPKECAF